MPWAYLHIPSRQLSVGFFSLPNHTKLLEQDFGIPIYTAELEGDLRLIYHIDFGAPTGTSDESQCPSGFRPIVTLRLTRSHHGFSYTYLRGFRSFEN